MNLLYEKLKNEATQWAKNKYPSEYPEVKEIFSFMENEGYLRKAQIGALRHYWFTRLVLETKRMRKLRLTSGYLASGFHTSPQSPSATSHIRQPLSEMHAVAFEKNKVWEEI